MSTALVWEKPVVMSMAEYRAVRKIELKEYRDGWYVENRDRILAERKIKYDARTPDQVVAERTYSREHARRTRAALRAVQIPVTREEKHLARLRDDPEYAARHQATAERRLADCTARSRARFADPTVQQEVKNRFSVARRTDPARFLIQSAKARAKKKGIEFTIVKSDITVPEHCPICGVLLCMSNTRWAGNSPTLDRIDPALGYVPSNIAVICFNCNAVKNNGTAELHDRIAAYMRKGGK